MSETLKKILNCAQCREDGSLVGAYGKYFVRVRRMSHCRFYKPGKYASCQTELCESPQAAIAVWNDLMGEVVAGKVGE